MAYSQQSKGVNLVIRTKTCVMTAFISICTVMVIVENVPKLKDNVV